MCKIYFAKLCNLLLYIMDFNFCWNKMSTKDLHLWGGDFYEDGLNQLLEQVFIHSYNTTKLNLYFLKILFTRILWHFSPPFLPTIWSLHFKSFSNFRVFFCLNWWIYEKIFRHFLSGVMFVDSKILGWIRSIILTFIG